ncbi:peptidyl-prolyl cis-trans isomerase [Maritimibacter sp. HL-12]|uniref:peptidyl-prolyl cis-trans isomerase n=1 Tax=Maritimibacter sp. HL-12 TaxID=1162418 RepID=UPI000A0F2B01|nr:peptidyl-prolyl cis-trans isomerase [Maritimibacter sp. HL-12]SMH29945.1 peptidyl-prolyl cis-trans isomerase D [Maritimibacter sp. HL-12]
MSMAQNKISRAFVWIIMGLVMVGLVGFGSFNFGGGVNAIGKVGETEISADRYFREVNAQINAFQAEVDQRLTFAEAQSIGLDQAALETVINQVALENENARLGISVGDDQLARRIRDIDAFHGPGGGFDRDTYNFVLQQSGLTAREFEETLRSEVARTVLQGAVTNGIALPPVLAEVLYGWARETRDFTWAEVGPDTLDAPVGTPDDATLAAFHEDNPDLFTLPEARRITYAWLTPEDVIDEIEVSEDELRALYESRIDEYRLPERRLVERLVFGTEAEAEAAAAAIESGDATFESVVAERGLDLADIDLGDVTEDNLGGAAADVFALETPGVVGPVMTDLGPALFRMNAILPARETSFETAREELRAEYADDAARRLLQDRMIDLDDVLAAGATLEDLASAEGMRLDTIDWTGAQTDGIAAYDAFRDAAETVDEDDYPAIDTLSDGGLFALRLDEVVQPRLQPLDEVRDEAIAAWQRAETLDRLAARAEEMLDQIEAGESPASLGLTEVIESGLSRDGFIEDAPSALVDRAFDLASGDWAVVEDESGVFLLHLDAVNAADQDSAEAREVKANFLARSAQTLALDIEAAFSAAIEAQAGITLDQSMINAVNTSFQ